MKKIHLKIIFSLVVAFVAAYVVAGIIYAPESIKKLELDETEVTSTNNEPTMSLTLTSSAFRDGEKIPAKHTCDGENISPELHISGVPKETKSLVLVMDDPDIPESVKESMNIEKFDHWVLYNISPETTLIKEGEVAGSEGLASNGKIGYVGSCPPDKEHRYFFRLYAMPNTLNFIKAPTLDEVETIAKESALESATLMGLYEREE